MVLAASFFMCNAQADKPLGIPNLKWLEGTWTMKVKNGTVSEEWKYLNDSTMTQKAFFTTNDGRKMPQETIELVSRNKEMFYISTVSGQNDGKAVPFKIVSLTVTGFISENPAHDYPQRITYTLQSPGKLLASIEGNRNGSFSKKEFPMVKE
jgi:hypothetical protein